MNTPSSTQSIESKKSFPDWLGPCLLLIGVAVAIAATCDFVPRYEGDLLVQLGARDFIAFWGAARAFIHGDNPYDTAQLLLHQKSAYPSMQGVQMFLNPPWMLPLFAPIAVFPFTVARYLWIALGVGFVVVSAFQLRRWYKAFSFSSLYITALIFTFLPFHISWSVGQLSPLSLFCVTGTIIAYEKKQEVRAGVLTLPLLIKPHLVFIPLFALFLHAFCNRRFRFIVTSMACALGLMFSVWLINPALFKSFLASEQSPYLLQTSTLGTLIRLWFNNHDGSAPLWPLAAVPLTGLGVFLTWWSRLSDPIDWRTAGPKLITLSLLFAPYAFPYDYTLLLFPFLGSIFYTFSWPLSSKSRAILICVALLPTTILFIAASQISNLAFYFWVPLPYLVITPGGPFSARTTAY